MAHESNRSFAETIALVMERTGLWQWAVRKICTTHGSNCPMAATRAQFSDQSGKPRGKSAALRTNMQVAATRAQFSDQSAKSRGKSAALRTKMHVAATRAQFSDQSATSRDKSAALLFKPTCRWLQHMPSSLDKSTDSRNKHREFRTNRPKSATNAQFSG